MKNPEQLRAELTTGVSELLMFRNSDQMRQWISVFDSLIASYHQDLMTVTPENLQKKQGALQQIVALRRLLCENSIDIPIRI